MTNTNTASPTKLRNGSWGARVEGSAAAGDTVTITTRGGKSWEARIERVIWTDGKVSICATESNDRPQRRVSRQEYCYGRCPVHGHRCSPEQGPCHDCE